jgi:glycine oxidase
MKVVIIGAGVAGLGIGWKLARAGANVTVLERAQVGNGATTASAGMIAATAELGETETPEAAFARRANALWPDFARDVQQESGVNVAYRRNGSLLVTMKGDNVSPSAESHGQGGDIEELDAAQAREREPMLSENITGALWAPHESTVDSQALCRALAVAFVRAGGKVLSNETVVRFERDETRILGVVTPFTTHHADVYVLAAGAWTSRIEGLPLEVVPQVIPVKGEILVLGPPQGVSPPAHVVWGNGVYLTPRGDRLLVGATVERSGFDTHVSEDALSWLRDRSSALMPTLGKWRIAEHWAGLRPGSPDGLPILGETAVEGLFVASGQYRNGILFAPAVAEMMSRLVLERTAGETAFSPRRFRGITPDAGMSIVETPHRA